MMTFKWWKIIKVKKKYFTRKIFHLITNERENKRNFFYYYCWCRGKKNSQKPMFRCCLKNKNFFPLIFENHTCWIEQKYSFFACLRKKKWENFFFTLWHLFYFIFFMWHSQTQTFGCFLVEWKMIYRWEKIRLVAMCRVHSKTEKGKGNSIGKFAIKINIKF